MEFSVSESLLCFLFFGVFSSVIVKQLKVTILGNYSY